MILIADSGSTKADWVLIDNHKVVSEFQTEGLSPVHLSEETIIQKLSAEPNLSNNSSAVKEIHFYGTGCGNEEGKARMVNSLESFFPSASIDVDNDLMAAALSTCGKEKGVVAILGTGSNCCYFDGKNIHLKNFGMGYIIGDEASGVYYGIRFIRAFLYGTLPHQLGEAFYAEYHLTRESVIDATYKKAGANVFLSSFMPFIFRFKMDAWMREFLRKGIDEFLESNVMAFTESKIFPVHFVGSVAAELEDILRITGHTKHLHVGTILKRPKDGLINFFLKK